MATGKFRVTVLLAAAILGCGAYAGAGQDTTASLEGAWLDRDVSVKYEHGTLLNIFASLGRISGVDFKVSPELNYPISLDADGSTVRKVLKLMEDTQGLEYRQEGHVVTVAKAQH